MWVAAIVVASGVSIEPPAPSAMQLTWTAPPQCPGAADVEARHRRLIEAAPLDRPRTPVVANATVIRTEDGRLRLTLHIERGQWTSERTVEADACEELADAVALIAAVAGDEARPEPPVSEPAKQPAQPAKQPTNPPTPVAAKDEPAPPPPGSRLRFVGRIFGGGSAGVLPGFGGGLGAQAGLGIGARPQMPRLAGRVELAAAYWFPRDRTVSDGRGGQFQMASGALRGCPVVVLRRVEFPLCAAVELGLLRGQGRSVRDIRSANDLWAGLGVAPGVAWYPIGWVSLWASAEGMVALRRPGFRLEDGVLVHRASAGAIRVLIGFEVHAPPWS